MSVCYFSVSRKFSEYRTLGHYQKWRSEEVLSFILFYFCNLEIFLIKGILNLFDLLGLKKLYIGWIECI